MQTQHRAVCAARSRHRRCTHHFHQQYRLCTYPQRRHFRTTVGGVRMTTAATVAHVHRHTHSQIHTRTYQAHYPSGCLHRFRCYIQPYRPRESHIWKCRGRGVRIRHHRTCSAPPPPPPWLHMGSHYHRREYRLASSTCVCAYRKPEQLRPRTRLHQHPNCDALGAQKIASPTTPG